MPIIRAWYPKDWAAIAAQVNHEAKWCCEQCQQPCRQPSEPLAGFLERVKEWRTAHTPPPPEFGEAPRRYLLTVARPENRDRATLKALCTVCHRRFDSRFRAMQKRLKAEFFGQLRIDDPADEGLQLSLFPNQVAPFSLPYQGEAKGEGMAR